MKFHPKFYELLQAYRAAPVTDQQAVHRAFLALLDYIKMAEHFKQLEKRKAYLKSEGSVLLLTETQHNSYLANGYDDLVRMPHLDEPEDT